MSSNGKTRPIIVSGFSSQTLAQDIAEAMGTRVVNVTRKQFTDKEIQTTIEANVRGQEVIVIASGSGDPNKQEKETRLLMRAAKRAAAKSVTLAIPYMWYGRSDDQWDERNSPALIDTIESLRSHCDNVVVVDPHNYTLTREKFLDSGSPVKSCTLVHLAYPFAVQIRSMLQQAWIDKDRLTFLHADAGASKRLTVSFRAALIHTLDLPFSDKKDFFGMGIKDRDKETGDIRYTGLSTDVLGKDTIGFEDMIGTAKTGCELADLLKEKGARSVSLFASSGLFSHDSKVENMTAAVDRINQSQIDAVFIADTYDHRFTAQKLHRAIEQSPKIHVIKTPGYLGAILSALHEDAIENDSDHNSISAILRGHHSQQAEFVQPVPMKCDFQSFGVK